MKQTFTKSLIIACMIALSLFITAGVLDELQRAGIQSDGENITIQGNLTVLGTAAINIPNQTPVNATYGGGYITLTDNPSSQTLTIGSTGQTLSFTTGTPSTAYKVKRGSTLDATGLNIEKAINASGIAGTTYGTGTLTNTYVSASYNASNNRLTITAKSAGIAGNGIPISTVETTGECFTVYPTSGVTAGGTNATYGEAGRLCYDSSNLYLCIGDEDGQSSWVYVQLETF